jgi:hypothetical protein
VQHIELDLASIEKVLNEWALEHQIAGLIAFLPETEKDHLPLLQMACRRRGIVLYGAIFPALVSAQGFLTHGAWLLSLERTLPALLIPALAAESDSAVQRIVAAVQGGLADQAPEAPTPTLFMIFDGMLPNIASLLDGIYLGLSNRVEYAGVNAGSETFQAMPCLFDDSQLISEGMLGFLLPGDAATVLEHGFVRPERAMTATSTEGNRIATINWRPAFDVYQEVIKDEYGIDLTQANFYQYAVHYPFGILRANGDVVVRIPVSLAADGSLMCVGEVPEIAMLMLLKAPAAGALSSIEHLAEKLATENGSLKGRRLLVFYCAGRRMHLGAAATSEITHLNSITGVAGMAGALSLGEIGSTSRWGYPVFHNATLLCRAWHQI